ncbi:hypothetical protein CVT26_010030 [Gymnopilus dilepis]|uniref:Uncharacterized protein n=1 Tax=Gymnopilus dilepis TaxID=231916 RepID=A0A409Y6X7_9AGAR|nr:hypothetical protein CVT26_010030 [Gymnopilus dilepis]
MAKASPVLAAQIWHSLCENSTTRGMTIAGRLFSPVKDIAVTITRRRLGCRLLEIGMRDRLQTHLVWIFGGLQNLIWIYPDQPWPRVTIHEVPLDPNYPGEVAASPIINRDLVIYHDMSTVMTAKARPQSFNAQAAANGTTPLTTPVRNCSILRKLLMQGVYIYGKSHKVSVNKGR